MRDDEASAADDLLSRPVRAAPLGRVLDGPWFAVGDRIVIQVGRDPRGVLYCTGLLVGWDGSGRRVTARGLRRLRLGEIVDAVGRLAEGGDAAALAALAPLVVPYAKPGPVGYDDDHYAMVSDAYRQAIEAAPRAPVRWLANHLYAHPSTVHRWLRRARDKGLLD